MLRVLFVFSIFLISNNVFGQADIYLDFTGGYSFIPQFQSVEELILTGPIGNPSIKFREEYKVKPGFNIEAGLDKKITGRFSINLGIGLSKYQFKRESNLEFVDNDETDDLDSIGQTGNPIGDYYGTQPGDIRFFDLNSNLGLDSIANAENNPGETKILYVAIPLRLQYSIIPDKLKIGIGATNYFVAYSSQIMAIIDLKTQPFVQKEYNDKSSNGLNNYQLSGDITIEYGIFKGLWIKAGYKNSFSAIYDKPQPSNYPTIANDKAKYRTVLIGLKYII